MFLQLLPETGKNIKINEVSQQPEFHVFTSMLWVRRSGETLDGFVNTPAYQEDHYNITIPDYTKPDIGLLRYHRDRMAASAEIVGWRNIPALQRDEHGLTILRAHIARHLQSLPELPPDSIERSKLRINVDKKGKVTIDTGVIDCIPTAEGMKLLNSFVPKTFDLQAPENQGTKLCKVYVHACSTESTVFTLHKTSHRGCYNEAREHAGVSHSIPTAEEVLLFNEKGEMMEGSLCTIYFNRQGKWITPSASSGGNLGVTRRVALQKGLCKEGTVKVTALRNGEKMWLSNAARGFFIGEICLKK